MTMWTRFSVATIAASVWIVGCAPIAQPVWGKPGASLNDFSRDKYTSLQESQQRAGRAYVNAYGGRSDEGVITNGQLFGACMNANGWYLTAAQDNGLQAPTRTSYVDTDEFSRNNHEICERHNTGADEINQCMARLNRRR